MYMRSTNYDGYTIYKSFKTKAKADIPTLFVLSLVSAGFVLFLEYSHLADYLLTVASQI